MTGGQPKQLAGKDSKGVFRFLPNFSVYVLPPDAVCLYSEDRKFFLHGELYCALASGIGAGKSRHEIVRALAPKFPATQIDEALKRLVERRFIVRASKAGDMSAAYWASLGLKPEGAAANLRKVRVSIRSLGGAGESELRAALSALAVRVVARSADLLVVLVNDYLDGALAELNRQLLAQQKSWILVQPSGIFPLVGPIFGPGNGACWTCLSNRMSGNRQVKAFLDRTQARCVVASPLSSNPFGQSAIALAAVEIAKAIATDFRSDLRHHIVSLDLMGSTIARHYVQPQPQCPACGRKELRDPSRAPVPIELRAGGKLIMTSGGYRSIPPAATVARFRKHVSPLTGVVSRLERVESTIALNATYLAKHNFSPRPTTVDALKVGLSGDSYGKGSTAEQSEASALMEAIERYCGRFQGDEIRASRRFADFRVGDAVHPNDIMLLSDAQYEGNSAAPEPSEGPKIPRRFDRSAEIEWSPVWSLRDKRFRHVPTGMMYYFYEGASNDQLSADSNGCAAGNSLEEAIVQGFLELVERDAYAIWWYNRLRRAEVDLEALNDDYIRDLRTEFAQAGRRLWALDITSDLGVPVVIAVSHWTENAQERIEFGAGAHFDMRIAALRAITELNQGLAFDAVGDSAVAPPGHDDHSPLPLRDHAYVLPRGKARVGSAPFLEFGKLDPRGQVIACVKLAKGRGLDFLVLDQTRPDIGVPVVKVIVPGLRHFYRRFAPGRLYDVPVKLGLRKRPWPEAELNPLHAPA
jgi:oxazoline/thiazoline synthase